MYVIVAGVFDAQPTASERQRENLSSRLRREFGLALPDDDEARSPAAASALAPALAPALTPALTPARAPGTHTTPAFLTRIMSRISQNDRHLQNMT